MLIWPELGVGGFLIGRGIPVLETNIIKSPRITILCESGRREKFGALNSRPWLESSRALELALCTLGDKSG